MKSYVMNVKTEVKRLEQFTSGYPACLPPFEVVECVTVENCSEPEAWWNYPKGYWAHRESSLKIMRLGKASGEDFLFFEDDAVFSPDFEEVFTAAVNHLPPEWDMLYPGGCHLDNEIFPPWQINDYLLRGKRIHWNTCFLINKKSVDRIIAHLEEPYWACTHIVDHRLNMLHYQPDFAAFSPMKFVVGQASGISTLNGLHYPEKWGNTFHYVAPDGTIRFKNENKEGCF